MGKKGRKGADRKDSSFEGRHMTLFQLHSIIDKNRSKGGERTNKSDGGGSG